MDPNLPRWIHASMRKHFDSEINIPLFAEGDDFDTRLKDWAEYRNDGPRERVLNGYKRYFVPVNILVKSSYQSDAYKIQRLTGIVAASFKPKIDIFRLGNGPDDTQTLVGCMILMSDRLNDLKINFYGQVDKTNKVQQASVEGHYEMFIKE